MTLWTTWRRRLAAFTLPQARERAARLPTAELFNATDAHLFYVGQNLQHWRRGYGDAALEAVEHNLLALLEITRELKARVTPQN